MQIAQVLSDLFALLKACEVEFMVGGSFASGAWGEPRHTNDIDIVADINAARAACLHEKASPAFLVSRAEMAAALESAEDDAVFQMLHGEALFKVNVFLLSSGEFDQSAFARRLAIEIVPGLQASCQSPEDMILRKLRWFELGNRVSDRQWYDVVKMLEIQRDSLDSAYLGKWARHLRVDGLLLAAENEAWKED